jgi:TIR domain
MPKHQVFLSYRRDDSSHQVGRIYDHLERAFGNGNVFKDVDSIPAGADFRRILEDAVAACDVLLVVIGDRWLTVADKSGQRRLDNPADFVRVEVESALGRGIPVVPVLVGSTAMPAGDNLPDGLRILSFRNAVQVRPDPDFHSDIKKLTTAAVLAAQLSPKSVARVRTGTRRAARVAAFFAILAAAGASASGVLAIQGPRLIKEQTQQPRRQGLELVPFELPKIQAGEDYAIEITKLIPVEKTGKKTVYELVDGVRVPKSVDYRFTAFEKVSASTIFPATATLQLYQSTSTEQPFFVLIATENTKLESVFILPTPPAVRVVKTPKEMPGGIPLPRAPVPDKV